MMNLTELGANAQQFLKAHSSERVSRWYFHFQVQTIQ